MSFVGEVNRLGALFVRPHDVEISHLRDPGGEEAMIERIVHLGFEVRVELVLGDGDKLWAQLTRGAGRGAGARARARSSTRGRATPRVFDEEGEPSTAELAV